MIAKKRSKLKSRVIRDKRGQVAGGFLDHPIVYVIILFGLAAIIGSVMMMVVGETDKVVAPNLDTPVVNNETWNFNGSDSSTFTHTCANQNLVQGVEVFNATHVEFTENTDYTVDHAAGTITNMSTGAIGGHADFVNLSERFGVYYNHDESKWNSSYANVVTGVALGFSMYKLVALMGIMSIVLPMLFLMFARRREE